ncbi:UPF0236 family transposase-like protein [Virgibacillus alimentarius]|uniref:UPF0236 family transposase-like protein n=1 Tax=Virgibacillus alimentarius TaxID=698769 RepID=UPI00068E7D13|nr:UPF0236 family protein [Virgibacillus alimentarius]
MAAKITYRETACVLKEWTAVDISNTMVGTIVRKVGEAQAKADEEIDFLYAEADGVFVRETEKKKSHEGSHAILYEGWDKSGKRVSLRNPIAVTTTQPTADFWKQIQACTTNCYSTN